MTSRPLGLPKEASPPSGNMEYARCISRIRHHGVWVWMWRGEQCWSISFSVFGFRVGSWRLSLSMSRHVERKPDREWNHSAKGNERLWLTLFEPTDPVGPEVKLLSCCPKKFPKRRKRRSYKKKGKTMEGGSRLALGPRILA